MEITPNRSQESLSQAPGKGKMIGSKPPLRTSSKTGPERMAESAYRQSRGRPPTVTPCWPWPPAR